LRLLALTFARTSERIGAQWSKIDLDGATGIVPTARMKMKRNMSFHCPSRFGILPELQVRAVGSRSVSKKQSGYV
jgi:integrase